MPILAYTQETCRKCGQGKNIDQPQTANNARLLIGALEKKSVATRMGVSSSYFSDLTVNPPRRDWNPELAEKFESAVNGLK